MSDVVPICTQLAVIERTISGINEAYDTTPSGVDLPVPVAVNLPFEGEISGAEGPEELMGVRQTIHRIKVQVLCAGNQADLQDAELQARPFLRRFVGTFDKYKTLNGTAGIMDVMVERYRYGFIELVRGSPSYIGYELITRVVEVEQPIYGTTGPATT